MTTTESSFKPITQSDLRRLGDIAMRDLESLFERDPDTGCVYGDRLFAIALCHDAASHFLDAKTGVRDFDVWSFFRAHPARPFPYRRNTTADFGNPKYGKSLDSEHFAGRRVELHKRSIYVSALESPVEPLRLYLSEQKSVSARALAEKAMILLYPRAQLGTVVWQAKSNRRRPVLRPEHEALARRGSPPGMPVRGFEPTSTRAAGRPEPAQAMLNSPNLR